MPGPTSPPSPRRSSPRRHTPKSRCTGLALLAAVPGLWALTATAEPGVAALDALGGPLSLLQANAPQDSTAAFDLEGLGLENLTVDPAGRAAAYENRRYRHSAEARGLAAARLIPSPARPVSFFERRLGLVAAAIVDTGSGVPAAVRYPSDGVWVRPPSGPVLEPTRHSLDIELVPLFSYDLGRILDPVLIRVELEPRLRYNPWPGGRATAAVIIPLRNDFPTDSLHPDIDRVRPGPVTLEQFAWFPHGALFSGTAGIFASNRYGVSVGAAVPFAQGTFLFDAQADATGYIAFPETGVEYSAISLWTGFTGLTYRPPALDLAVRLRAQRFLYGDQGVELELRRSMGDLDIAFFVERTGGFSVQGVRLDIPLPPRVRPTGQVVRVLPVARMPISYSDESAPVGRAVSGVASREDFLRQLSLPGLSANAGRYGPRPPGRRFGGPQPPLSRVSLTGTTGFINTPWCGVMEDRRVEIGYNRIPKEAAYDHRESHANDVYYSALGFLPRIEVGFRWTVIPGLKAFADLVPESRLTDSDRMLSGRIELLTPRPGRPGLAIGIEDAVGTRRFHSTYGVTGIPFEYQGLHTRVALGYASRVLTASRHTLDGAFGAVEVTHRWPVALAVEYDTEKWNAGLGVDVALGIRTRVALLDWQHVSLGVGWSVAL